MKFADAIDEYIADKQREGRLNSHNSIHAYRACLEHHCDDVNNRDPAKTGRNDVKRTLGRWPHPNTQRQKHAILTSFYDWCATEGIRDTNPARNVIRARARDVSVFRPTLDEVVRLMDSHPRHAPVPPAGTLGDPPRRPRRPAPPGALRATGPPPGA
jgi:site-specific recombinase XerD